MIVSKKKKEGGESQMRYTAEVKMIDDKILLVHFVKQRPDLRGERFKCFVEKLEKVLQKSLKGVRIILCPHPLKGGETIEINWSRFEENFFKFRLKDFIKDH